MADSFRALVAEVVGKYPQYQQILKSIQTEHTGVKGTLNAAKNEINRLDTLSKEYVRTLNGIRQTTENARDAALRYSEDSANHATSAKHFRDTAKVHKDEAYKLFLQIETAINQLNQIAKDYENIDMRGLLEGLLREDNNFEVALNRIVSLLVLEPKYLELRDEILQNQKIILQDIKLQAKLAQDLYTDARDMLAVEKIDAFLFLQESEKRLEQANKAFVQANQMVDLNRDILLNSLRNEWQNGINQIRNERDNALFKITDSASRANNEILAKEANINALFSKTQEIIKDSEELADLTKNYAFVSKVRNFTAVKRLLDAASYANNIQSQSQKAILTYTQYEARISRNEAEYFRNEAERLKIEASKTIAKETAEAIDEMQNLRDDSLVKMSSIKTDTIREVTDIKTEAIAKTTEIKNEAITNLTQIKTDTIAEVTQIKDEAINQTTELKNQTEEMLNIAQDEIKKDVEHVEDLQSWLTEKVHLMFVVSHLKGARVC